MGIVYAAEDTRLGRKVAIKTLPDEFSRDPHRVARFQREAEVLASLNHPNIAQVYGLEDSTSQRCIVMELVEGDTLLWPVPDSLTNSHERAIFRPSFSNGIV
jgi:eukaryotic-like serine/threonine-protein kinase